MKYQSGLAPILIVMLIALLIAIGGGAYFMMHRGPMTPSTATSTTGSNLEAVAATSAPEPLPTGEFSMDVTSLLGRRQNLECDVKSPSGAAQNYTGKLWTTGDKGRSTLSATIAKGMTMEMSAIYKDGTMSMWSYMNGNLVMAKTLNEADADKEPVTAEQKAQAEQYKSKMILNCHPWTPDMSKFETPAGVTFTPMELPTR